MTQKLKASNILASFLKKAGLGLLSAAIIPLLFLILSTNSSIAQNRVASDADESVYHKVPKRKLFGKERRKSSEMRSSDKGQTKLSGKEKNKKASKSKELNEGSKLEYKISKKELNRERTTSEEASSSDKGMRKVSRSERGSAERASKDIAEGDKISRKVSKRSLKREELKSKEISEADKLNYKVSKRQLNRAENNSRAMADSDKRMYKISRRTLGREERKSKDILNYKAGYLNTKAERRARIRSFFRPGDYPPNTPEEKIAKARRNSKLAYEYKGDIVVRRKNKNMHPSSAYQGGKVKNSYNQKERHRKRMLKRSRGNKKENLPRFMRKKESKPRYDDVEKGLWND